jgi:ubiquinone/menaquinone biosynthesis C-methylase UbiE
MGSVQKRGPSLENLVERENLGLEVLHPGGLEITKELATLCHIGKGSKVLDVASGTGESACYLQKSFDCQIVGVDISDYMIERAEKKVTKRHLQIQFKKGNAHHLPFDDNTFDAVISECTLCILEKAKAIGEMIRVTKPDGYVGFHDICWKENTPEYLKQKLVEIEGEKPETLDEWKRLFETMKLEDVRVFDKSYLISPWLKGIRKELGFAGQIKIFLKVLRTWGFRGLNSILESEQIFQNEHTGYCIVVGRKPLIGVS